MIVLLFGVLHLLDAQGSERDDEESNDQGGRGVRDGCGRRRRIEGNRPSGWERTQDGFCGWKDDVVS